MKKVIQRAVILLVYLLALLYVTGFRWENMFDAASFGMVIFGMLLLSAPQWLQTIKFQKRPKLSDRQLLHIFLSPLPGNALLASYIAAAVTLLARLSGNPLPSQAVGEIALGCRPVLYGLLFYALFHGIEETRGETAASETGTEKWAEDAPGETRDKAQMTTEQLCCFFRARGLTAREAEVARLLYLGCSNREIAGELFIAETTVKKHVTHILEKLGLEQRGQIREMVYLTAENSLCDPKKD